MSIRNRNEQKSVKLDFGSVMISVLITVIVLAAAQVSSLNISLFKSFQLDFNPFNYADESGQKFEQGVTAVPLLPEAAHQYESFAGKKKPRMDLTVTFPAVRTINMDVHLINGSVRVYDIRGDVDLSTVNGRISAASVAGDVKVNEFRCSSPENSVPKYTVRESSLTNCD